MTRVRNLKKFALVILVLLILTLVPTVMAAMQADKLTASNGSADDEFGYSVAVDGTTVVVGAHAYDSYTGAVYVFDCSSYPCTEVTRLEASDGASNDSFGYSVAISGTRVVVGAYLDQIGIIQTGSAYVFDDVSACGATCTEDSKLTASDGAGGDQFGYSVAISGTRVVVGAPKDDGGGDDTGSAYVFDDVSTCGAACTQDSKLTASNRAAYDYFGWSVGVSGTAAVVGALYADNSLGDAGLAYSFNDVSACGAACNEDSILSPASPAGGDWFGASVAIDGTRVVVGSPGFSFTTDWGAAYVFNDVSACGATCNQDTRLRASDRADNDDFGRSVSVDGTTVVVGSDRADDDGGQSGSAYVFDDVSICGAGCSEDDKLTASDAAAGDQFGYSVAISGTRIVAGAPYDADNGSDSGSAYVFDLGDFYDFGDAPDPTYPTLLASTGAQHLLDDSVYLGACVDSESDGQPTATADGDDTTGGASYGTCTGGDDEDGVTFTSVIAPGTTADVDVTASAVCTLSAWIDFNQDGDWADVDEDIFPGGQALTAGVNSLSYAVPAGAAVGDTFARFRCTTDGAVAYTGLASDGEVEDYQVTIVEQEIDVQRPAGTSIADGGNDAVGALPAGPATLTYTIDNTAGGSTLTIPVGGVTASGLTNVSGFTVNTALPLAVGAGATATLEIGFTIDGLGAFSFDLDIDSDDADENPYDIAVSGTGTNSLAATAACHGDDLRGQITAGDGPFDITGSGPDLPIYGVGLGQYESEGPDLWQNVIITETTGDMESINLGDFDCYIQSRSAPKTGSGEVETEEQPAAVSLDATLSLSAEINQTVAVVGDMIIWTFTVTNHGNTPTGPLTFSADLPDELADITVTTAHGTVVSAAPPTAIVDLESIPAGGSAVVTISGTLGESEARRGIRARVLPGRANQEVGESVCVLGMVADLSANACVTLFPDTLPDTGGEPVGSLRWLYVVVAAIVTVAAGWFVRRRLANRAV